MPKHQDDDIDLERAAMDPDYRRRVLKRLKAQAEGGEPAGESVAPAPQHEAAEPQGR